MNLGIFDRLIRLLAGLGFVFFDYIATSNWEIIFFIIGAWGVMTSVFGWCPFYRLMGIDTCPTNFNVTDG
ncbi:MAG: DUF2892 domain-containing protein [Methanobacteriota archaeon]|nr:MAG: DUF2892 domain-containing protein [Euryarchaeota archaeon]|tara:strand:- start:671 stop:880 length:210 start_codon:yes stop_codon:yes gene_type:complete